MPRVRMIFVAVLGTMLGSAFTPQIFDHLQFWADQLPVARPLCCGDDLRGAALYYARVAGY